MEQQRETRRDWQAEEKVELKKVKTILQKNKEKTLVRCVNVTAAVYISLIKEVADVCHARNRYGYSYYKGNLLTAKY
jgi:aspartate aminotransferase-like enzyme